MKKRTLQLMAFGLASFLLIVAVFKYEAAGVATIAAAFALIAEILANYPTGLV